MREAGVIGLVCVGLLSMLAGVARVSAQAGPANVEGADGTAHAEDTDVEGPPVADGAPGAGGAPVVDGASEADDAPAPEGTPPADAALATDAGTSAAPDPDPASGRVSADGPCIGSSSPAAARVCEGLALAAARRWAQAERAIESALELVDPMVEARRAQLEEALGQAREQLGSLEVRTFPEGVRVSVDGVLAGTTPIDRPLRLLPGEHLVRGTLADHGATEAVAVITAGDLTLTELQLTPHDDRPILERVGDPGEAQRVVGLVAISFGVIALTVGVGTLVGGLAGMPDDAEMLLNVSRGMLIAGGVLLVGGIVLALTS